MAPWTILYTIAVVGMFVDATPTISFPVNAQVPPVARVSEPFSYSFSSSTFSSTSTMTYAMLKAPSWLSLDSNTRTLSGTPSSSDVGVDDVTGVHFELIATDETGSATLDVTLVVSKNSAPVINIPAAVQLQYFGLFSAPSTLLYHPSSQFAFSFSPQTFLDNATSLEYYAVSLNNTPLPSWVEFDGGLLSFTGQTPDYVSLIQPPQTFGFRLIASDVQGFAGASITFEIEVGVHLLSFDKQLLQVNATAESALNFSGLSNTLQLDGASANASSLISITAQTPSWLEFNNSTFILSGIPPSDASCVNVTVVATDVYRDVATTSIYIDIATAIFNRDIGTLNATISKSFSYTFGAYLRNSSDVDMTAQFLPATSWLLFDSQNLTLYGQVPSATQPLTINVTLNAVSKTSQKSSSESFNLSVVMQPSTSTTGAETSTLSSTVIISSSTARASANPSSVATIASHRGLTKGQIAAIVVPSALAVLALLACMFLCFWRRRKAKKHFDSPEKSEISGPVEARSLEATTPPYTEQSETLHLDTTGFMVRGYTDSPRGGIKRNADGTLRRSQTMSMISGARMSGWRDSQSSGIRTRSYSENALSKTDSSWRSTQGSSNQDSAYPKIGSRTSSSNKLISSNKYSLSRNYSNYSRKGHTRRSTRAGSREGHLRDSDFSLRPSTGASILNLGDSSFSSTPLDNFSVLSEGSSVQQTPEIAYAATRPRPNRDVDPTKRYSRWITSLDQIHRRASGIGHGGRDSLPSLPDRGSKRRSVGHGQDRTSTSDSSRPSGPGPVRESMNWQTINTNEYKVQNRRSKASNTTESTDLLYTRDPRHMSVKEVPKSPFGPPSVVISESSVNSSRPVSRRTIGTSPFFGGGGGSSSRVTRKSPRPLKEHLYADSPTVPEEPTMASQQDLEKSIMRSLRRRSDAPRDSFGISYGTTREGTDRLRSYISTQLDRTQTQNSIQSNTSRDSRFESVHTEDQIVPGSREGETAKTHGAEWEDYLPDDYSEGSWEDVEQHSPSRDSKGNIIEYAPDDSPHVETAEQAAAQGIVKPQLLSSSSETGNMAEIGPNARILPGAGRRPVSVDAKGKRSASPNASHSIGHVDQEDYRAYI